jgi:hypothetical protein
MITLRKKSKYHFLLRMHEDFAKAPHSLLQDVESYIVHHDEEAWKRVSAFARSIPDLQRPYKPKRVFLYPQGRHFHLDPILDEVRNTYFSPELEARITWGKNSPGKRKVRRSIIFGSWNEELKLIRIHPALDQEWVPLEFMHYLVYHELCHAVAKPETGSGGRRSIHHRAFKELENQYPDITRMHKLSTELLKRIAQAKQ